MPFLTKLFPPGTRYFIAGGWAACPSLAADIDVWVQVNGPDELVQKRQSLLDYFRTHGPHVVVEEKMPPTGPVLDDDNYYGVQTLKVCRIHQRHSIHVMVTDGTVEQVIEGFDVSTHMIAITDYGVYRGPDWTPITCRPRAVNPNSGTPARLAKISKRFGFLYSEQEVVDGEVTQQSV